MSYISCCLQVTIFCQGFEKLSCLPVHSCTLFFSTKPHWIEVNSKSVTCGGGCTGGGALLTGILRCIWGGWGRLRLGGARGWTGAGAGARAGGGAATTGWDAVLTAMGDKSMSNAWNEETMKECATWIMIINKWILLELAWTEYSIMMVIEYAYWFP